MRVLEALENNRTNAKVHICIKAELPQEGILFRTQFPSLGIFNNKSWISKKLRPPREPSHFHLGVVRWSEKC